MRGTAISISAIFIDILYNMKEEMNSSEGNLANCICADIN